MQTYTANEAKTRFGEFLDRVQREPVRVMRHDRVAGVTVSADDYEAMRTFYADRLRKTMNETALMAKKAGLTPEILEQLLADESGNARASQLVEGGRGHQRLDQRLANPHWHSGAVDAPCGAKRASGVYRANPCRTEGPPMAPKFDRYVTLEQRKKLLSDIESSGLWVEVPPAVLATTYGRDAADDMFIHAAQAAESPWLVTGDDNLLCLHPLGTLHIISPRAAYSTWNVVPANVPGTKPKPAPNTSTLLLKYHDSITDAIAGLGQPEDIGKVFSGGHRL